MSLRPRIPAPVAPPVLGWSDTLSALAEIHRSRRAADESSRWPLAHACSRPTRAGEQVVGAAADRRSTGQPFCCRALA